MSRIKCLENFSIDGVLHHEGDVMTVSDEVAQTACSAGWAEDVDGKYATGVRDPAHKKLDVGKVEHDHKPTDAN